MTRVLGATSFLSTTNYYDERGALIQTLEDNIKQGTDITTVQYHFDGRVLSKDYHLHQPVYLRGIKNNIGNYD